MQYLHNLSIKYPMRLEWLEDLVAVLETDSLNAAAARRFLTQPAFSRRLRTIEGHVSAALIDRTHKPARALPALSEQQHRIRELATGLRDLLHELKRPEVEGPQRIVIVSQHAITATLVPELVKRLDGEMRASLRLRSENHAECLALLMARQAQLTLTYRSVRERRAPIPDYLEEVVIARESLVPVIAHSALATFEAARAAGELPIVAYPSDVFLGQVFAREVRPRLPGAPFIQIQAETALTLAALRIAAAGVGVAWVPHSLARRELSAGALADLRRLLPHCELEIVAARLAGTQSAIEAALWEFLRTLRSGNTRGASGH